MKKTHILFFGLILSVGVQAQTRWYNYAETKSISSYNATSTYSALSSNYLFPDTAIKANFAGVADSRPWIHSLANVLDVTSGFFNNVAIHPGEMALPVGSTFKVDSMSVLVRYRRKNTGVVDTLFVQVGAGNLPTVNLTDPNSAPAIDAFGTSITYKRLWYNHIFVSGKENTLKDTLAVYQGGIFTYKIPLNDAVFADSTADGKQNVKFATPGLPTITAGTDYVVSAIKFVPGYSYTMNDTLNNKNYVKFISAEERGVNTFIDYVYGDYNLSYTVELDVLYNSAPSYKNKRYDPSFSFSHFMTNMDYSWPYENHYWGYKVTAISGSGTVSVNDLASSDFTNGIKLGQNVPNPSKGLSTINYELNNNTVVSFTVCDILGKEVMTVSEGAKTAGKHTFVMSTHQLQSGVYFYTLQTTSGVSLTRKMIVTE